MIIVGNEELVNDFLSLVVVVHFSVNVDVFAFRRALMFQVVNFWEYIQAINHDVVCKSKTITKQKKIRLNYIKNRYQSVMF